MIMRSRSPRVSGEGPGGDFSVVLHRMHKRFRPYFGPKLMDFDVFIWNMDSMDMRNPNPGSE